MSGHVETLSFAVDSANYGTQTNPNKPKQTA